MVGHVTAASVPAPLRCTCRRGPPPATPAPARKGFFSYGSCRPCSSQPVVMGTGCPDVKGLSAQVVR